jgi:hypothetical protein
MQILDLIRKLYFNLWNGNFKLLRQYAVDMRTEYFKL